MNVNPRYNQFQLFVLAFLATEEKKQEESGQAFGRPNPNNLPIPHRYVTTISELSLKVPPSSLPDEPTGLEMLHRIEAQIDELKHDELLENDSQFSYDRQPQDQGFYITAAGRIYVRKHYHGLIAIVENKKKYEQTIDALEADSASKKYLKNLRDKLINKTEDRIIEIILSNAINAGKEYSTTIVRFVAVLLQGNGSQ